MVWQGSGGRPAKGAKPPSGGSSAKPPNTESGLRDWFAGLAMQAVFAGPGARNVADRDERYDETNWSAVVAANAYEMADAMLAHRAEQRKT